MLGFIFFFNDTATTEIYTLSLHDALPICPVHDLVHGGGLSGAIDGPRDAGLCCRTDDHDALARLGREAEGDGGDRKSTRLNSSHANISYAVFCLKKKKNQKIHVRVRLSVP